MSMRLWIGARRGLACCAAARLNRLPKKSNANGRARLPVGPITDPRNLLIFPQLVKLQEKGPRIMAALTE
jgi:hypothetical protein